MQKKIKELRVKIDGLSQLTKELKPCKEVASTGRVHGQSITIIHHELWDGQPRMYSSYELGKAYDSLILAKAWLGKILGELPNNGKLAIITDLVFAAQQYIKENNLDPKNCVIVTDILHTRGYEFSNYKYLAISNKFYKDIKEATGEVKIDVAIHKFFTEMCGYVGNPYANDGNRKTVEDIEPAADKHTLLGDTTSDFNLQFTNIDGTEPSISWTNKTHIEKVDWLRQEIETLVNEITNLKSQLSDSTFNVFSEKEKAIKAAIASTNTYNHLYEARFYLGFELQRIRENG